jgi:succinate dehydrogenase / fumarate reductase membrane anchor subunit
MRESTFMLINYVMILILLVTLALHIAMQGILGVTGYENALTYSTALARYKDAVSASLLAILLVAATYHGLWGLRNILLELRTGPRWTTTVSGVVLTLGVVMLGWGLRTIAIAFGGL